jgi:hypothetical protein
MVSGFNFPVNQSTEWDFGEAHFHANPFFGVLFCQLASPGVFVGAISSSFLIVL